MFECSNPVCKRVIFVFSTNSFSPYYISVGLFIRIDTIETVFFNRLNIKTTLRNGSLLPSVDLVLFCLLVVWIHRFFFYTIFFPTFAAYSSYVFFYRVRICMHYKKKISENTSLRDW